MVQKGSQLIIQSGDRQRDHSEGWEKKRLLIIKGLRKRKLGKKEDPHFLRRYAVELSGRAGAKSKSKGNRAGGGKLLWSREVATKSLPHGGVNDRGPVCYDGGG